MLFKLNQKSFCNESIQSIIELCGFEAQWLPLNWDMNKCNTHTYIKWQCRVGCCNEYQNRTNNIVEWASWMKYEFHFIGFSGWKIQPECRALWFTHWKGGTNYKLFSIKYLRQHLHILLFNSKNMSRQRKYFWNFFSSKWNNWMESERKAELKWMKNGNVVDTLWLM